MTADSRDKELLMPDETKVTAATTKGETVTTTTEPTEADLASAEFNAVWDAIKGWDLERERGAGYAGATGTDVVTILNAIRGAGLKIVPGQDQSE